MIKISIISSINILDQWIDYSPPIQAVPGGSEHRPGWDIFSSTETILAEADGPPGQVPGCGALHPLVPRLQS